ncbi:MAG: division plane positioning ATPase MipZ [Alphaproteobacteria bacterium]|nr:division plane positioning ATPase MipZ [Alphaproteobacteria bacterium]
MTQSAHIIIFGNTVRGSGKSLTAAQLAVALLRAGHRIGTIDLDEDDEGLSLFLHRRRDHDADLPQPLHRRLPAAGRDDTALENALTLAITDLSTACDFIIIDTPHGDQTLAKLAHAYADTLITPLREDTLSALATLKSNTARIETVTPYAEMVEDQNIRRLDRGAAPIHWLVLRTRILNKPLRNKRQSLDLFDKLSSQLGFQPLQGLHERPLYKDLFAQGLTVFDLTGHFDLAAVAARQEVRGIINALSPTPVNVTAAV